MTATAYLNAIGTAVPDHDIHDAFIGWARAQVATNARAGCSTGWRRAAGIAHRWSVLPRGPDGGSPVAAGGFYADDRCPARPRGCGSMPRPRPRWRSPRSRDLRAQVPLDGITHLVVASCTGFVAPGIDQIIAARLGLAPSVERLLVGFMGCYAAVAALRSARHIVRSRAATRACWSSRSSCRRSTCRPATELEPLLAMLQFGDGAAAALVTARRARASRSTTPFATTLARFGRADPLGHHRPRLRDASVGRGARRGSPPALADADFARAATGGRDVAEIDGWAVHAGGRSILDAVEQALAARRPTRSTPSRAVLADYGNMSSATLMFVLARLLAGAAGRRTASRSPSVPASPPRASASSSA